MRLTVAALLLTLPSTFAATVMLGDSMFAGGSSVQRYLEEWAGHGIDNKAIVGASLHEGWTKSIPGEWQDLDKTTVPTTIILDGGGNDAISVKNDCADFNDNCIRQLDEAVDIAKNLLEDMHQAGVAHVIYMGFFYIGGLQQAADYGTDKLIDVCKNAALDCVFADPRAETITTGWDGVHPNDEGYGKLAKTIWEAKLQHDIPL